MDDAAGADGGRAGRRSRDGDGASDPYDLFDRAWGRPEVVCLPDGSVDGYCRVFDGRDDRVTSCDRFGARVADGRTESVRVRVRTCEPGGQAVNAARQADALGGDVTLFGHLDHPVFDDLPFATRSMGDPSRVRIFEFEDGAFTVAEESADLRDWTLEVLLSTADARPRLRTADVVCVGNWESLPGVAPALASLASFDELGASTVVVDPGDLTGSAPDAVSRLGRALATLGEERRVVLSGDEAELAHVADALDVSGETPAARLGALRRRLHLSAAVVHDAARALAATPDGPVRVPNLRTPETVRTTGAGDRFDGGLAFGLADGLPWASALALGNACASYYVATGETPSTDTLEAHVEQSTVCVTG